jgi:arginyl-tRNA synthetase
MIREEIIKLIEKSIKELQREKALPLFAFPEIKIEYPERKDYGDYATNVAMVIAKQAKKNPIEVGELIKSKIKNQKLFDRIEVVKPGFINFFVSKEYLRKQIGEISKQKFGQLKIGKGKKINVEFISANPTGPLHIGNGRGGFCGDVLSNVLEKAGYKIFREYYVNDMGRQIEILKNSLEGREPSYKNQYIDELKKKGIREKDIRKAIKFIVGEIKKTTERMRINFDKWFYESDLYKTKEVDKVLDFLKKKKLTYEKEGALWFKSTKFGDDKDRVLVRKADEKETYFLSDIAYLRNKFKRGFDYLIIFLGAEHHGYTGRLWAAAEALGYDKDKVRPIIMQLVKLLEEGRQVRMSKRTGIYVTLDELIDEIGPDVSRFFFLMRSPGVHLNFDLDLAKQQSEKNPVYYVQYAHARICSILRKSKMTEVSPRSELLEHPSELRLIKQLIRLPEIVADTSKDYQVQRLPQYAMETASAFHQFYRDCRVISDNKRLTKSRLTLIKAAKIVLKNTLDLMGISAPEKM